MTSELETQGSDNRKISKELIFLSSLIAVRTGYTFMVLNCKITNPEGNKFLWPFSTSFGFDSPSDLQCGLAGGKEGESTVKHFLEVENYHLPCSFQWKLCDFSDLRLLRLSLPWVPTSYIL